ncbi:MAG: aminotransferase class V-fold PLP-dependent enzyme [Pirellulales bacterium]|nr:aminotransferase class V-fold PLP-dependent enzyme [Pirellulales bacterium]
MLTEETRRLDFPSLEGRTYLNTAAEGIPPRRVAEALAQYAEDKLLGMDGRSRHEAQWDALRELTGQAMGLTAAEIGICSCSSEAFNLASLALRLCEGDEVVINDLDFPAGTTPWLQEGCSATTKLWRSRAGALRTEDLAALLTPRTRLVSMSLVSFYNGFRLPLAETLAVIRKHSPALVALDVTQAFGRVSMDLADVDLIVSSTHKWMLGIHGGCLVGVPRTRAGDWTVPAGGWFNLENAFNADRFERARAKPGAASFSLGMPNYAAVYANCAALAYLRDVSVAAIEQYATPLMWACLDGLKKLEVELLAPDDDAARAGIIAFRHPRADAIHDRLHAQGIHIMNQAGRLRVALHGYNTMADVDRFLSTLREAVHHV